MMEIFRNRDWECQGTEIVSRLRDKLITRGFTVYGGVTEIPPDTKFHAITLIDSLYCFSDPRSILEQLKSLVMENGVIVIRIANRTPLVRLLSVLSRGRIDNRVFGDQVVLPSHQAMQCMLNACGLSIRSVHTWEAKPLSMARDPRRWFYYRIMPIISVVTGMKISPGLLYVCTFPEVPALCGP